MRYSLLLVMLSVAACTALRVPTSIKYSPAVYAVALRRQRLDLIDNIRRLIEELVENLRKAAKDALDAVTNFRDYLLEKAKLIQDEIMQEIQKLRDRVETASQSVNDKFVNSATAVRECIEKHRGDAETVFNNTLKDSIACAADRIKEIGDRLDCLTSLANNTSDIASAALDKMRECINQNQTNTLAVGSCLGSVVLQTQTRGANFVAESGLQIGRLNLAMATLPAALQMCAGARLFQAGVATARLVMEIGGCSASSVFSIFASSTSS